MDRDEAFDRLGTILRHFETANQLLLSEGIIEKDEDFSEENAYLNKAREALDYLAKQSPDHPAIPEDVRNTLVTLLSGSIIHNTDATDEGLESARDWLAKCHEATDRAVCPKCWESDECTWAGIGKIRCWRCRHDFAVQVLVISPPRESKETI